MKTLLARILGSFILLIMFTVFLTTGIEYISTSQELPRLLTEVRTKNIAHILGAAYTRDGGWDNLEQEIGWLEEGKGEDTPIIRIVVRDSQDKTLYNSFAQLTLSSNSPLIEGGSHPLFDFERDQRVGTITAFIDKTYLERETTTYILSLLKPRLFQGVMTIFLALMVAFLLSRRITEPIRSLTKAAEAISLQENTQFLPVESHDELGRMSESFNRMIDSLESQRELRKRLISDVSHEILSPLNIIRLEARGLLDKITLPFQGAPRIIEEVDRMKDLIHDLDWLAETDSGEYKLKREMISLEPLLIKERDIWALKAEVMGKSLSLQKISDKWPALYADPLRLSQALGNLIENALKYSRDNSPVIIGLIMEEGWISISVKDEGKGITKEDGKHLFERFYRVDRVRTPHEGGRGLGLAIVKQIAELHGGRVWFTSRLNEGSTFYLTLPGRNHQSDG